jgi:hypothetical protein
VPEEPVNFGLLVPTSPNRWAERQRWRAAVAGPPPIQLLVHYRPVVDQQHHQNIKRKGNGRVWMGHGSLPPPVTPPANWGVLDPTTTIRWTQRQWWRDAMGGFALRFPDRSSPLYYNPTARKLADRNRGSAWTPSLHVHQPETWIVHPYLRIGQDKTAAALRNRNRGRAWIPGGQQVHQPETPIVHPWSAFIVPGKRPPRAGRVLWPPPLRPAPAAAAPYTARPTVIARRSDLPLWRARNRGSIWLPGGQKVHQPETWIVHPWSVLLLPGKRPPRAGRVWLPGGQQVHQPETPVPRPWSTLLAPGRRPPRAGSIWLPGGRLVHQPETWVIHPYLQIAQQATPATLQNRNRGRAWLPGGQQIHEPETWIVHPWSVLLLPGKRPPRAGRAWLEPPARTPPPPPPTITAWPRPIDRRDDSRIWRLRDSGWVWLPGGRLVHLPETPVVHPWSSVRIVPGRRPPRAGKASPPRVHFPETAGSQRPPYWLISRRDLPPARRPRGWTVRWAPAPFVGAQPTIGYNVYANTGAGDPINYAVPIATVYALSYTTSALSFPGTWKLAVRAFNQYGEEQNLDCEIDLILDGSGNDITNRPLPPIGLRAFATKSAGIRAEWAYPPPLKVARTPTGFHVYTGTGGTPNYGSPAATIPYKTAVANMFVSNLSGLTGGTAYTIGVRAYNAVAEEPNTNTVTVTAVSAGPTAVDSLAGSAVVGS